MDEGLSQAVQTIFKRLYDDGLIYRAERIINWCPRCLTALSDIEVEHSDDDGELVSIRYGDGDARSSSPPPGPRRCSATPPWPCTPTTCATAPDRQDGRAAADRPAIPIVADEHVDPAFGTGAVKVTPAHDPNDFEIGRRHDLPVLTIMDEHGVITAHGPFQGLDRFEARPAVVARAARGRPDRRREAAVHARGRALPPVRHDGRAAAVAAVVRPRRPAGEGGRRRGPRRPGGHPPELAPGTSTGSTTCTTGASAASCGGATASRSSTGRTASGLLRPGRAAAGRLDARTPTCSTPGSPPRCGRSRRWAGPRTRRTCARSTRPACWSPATTSCSSGSPG